MLARDREATKDELSEVRDSLRSSVIRRGVRIVVSKQSCQASAAKGAKRRRYGDGRKPWRLAVAGIREDESGRRSRKFIDSNAIVDMSYSKVSRSTVALGDMYGIHRSSVNRAQQLNAAVLIKERDSLLMQTGDAVVDDKPSFSNSSLAFDETLQQLAMPMTNLSEALQKEMAQATKSSWHVMVAKQTLTIGREHITQGKEDYSVGALDILRPPAPLISTQAESIYHGLFQTKMVEPIMQTELKCFEHSEYSSFHVDRDGATSVSRTVQNRFAELPSRTCCSDLTCGNHRNQLVEVAVVQDVSMKSMTGLYTTVKYLRMGANFVRLVYTAPSWVNAHLKIRTNEKPPTMEATPYNAEASDEQATNHQI
jgi:hypothetical protein